MIFLSGTFSPSSGIPVLKVRCINLSCRFLTEGFVVVVGLWWLMRVTLFSHLVLKTFFQELRYIFSRFYFWCIIPGVQDSMEGCPNDDVIVLYTILSGFVGTVMFLVYEAIRIGLNASRTKATSKQHDRLKDDEFVDLQIELYGIEVLSKESLSGTSHSRRGRSNTEESVTKVMASAAVSDTDQNEFSEVDV
jgi:hypothetical protein